MKIATWNIQRWRHRKSAGEMLALCEGLRADILVLTEADRRFQPAMPCAFHTPLLGGEEPDAYKPTENRVSIYTRYNLAGRHPTHDPKTALCVELETEEGPLLVYGTIIGIHGNRCPSYKEAVAAHVEDFRQLAQLKKPLCICGDFNCSFADNYYFTTEARNKLNQAFAEHNLVLATANTPACIDHIALSQGLIGSAVPKVEEWNTDKRLSDHKGIVVSF